MREQIRRYLPQELSGELAEREEFAFAEELRIRAGKHTVMHANGQEYILSHIAAPQSIRRTIAGLAEHSAAAFAEELRQGFFTVGGGVRIGVAGRAVCEGGRVRMLRDYTALNIRFPREFPGISGPLLAYTQKNGRILNTLIISAPQHGKTTLLRDMIRAVADGDGYFPQKCAVIDERGEISGGTYFDLGLRSDVLLGCPKAEGLNMALRTLSPEVIATDEIGGERDRAMLAEAAAGGVKILATAHAASVGELERKEGFRALREIIERTVLLTEKLGRGTVGQIYDAAGMPLLQAPVSIRGDVSGC